MQRREKPKMTEQGKPVSKFNQRADGAALALKGELSQRLGKDLPSKQVEVGPDGRPPKPLPPEGSYMRSAIDQHRAALAAQQAGQPTQEQILGDQPPAGTPEQAIDGSQGPPLTPAAQPPQEQAPPPLSESANQRIQDLANKLRMKDQELQSAVAQAKAASETQAELQGRLKTVEEQHSQMLQANLDNLDPDTRAAVLQDARMREYFDKFREQLLGEIQPQLSGLQENRMHDELMRLADKYPSFDVQVHGMAIDSVRGKNPHLSIEQAFKVVAEPEELVTRTVAAAVAVPPVVPPGAGGVQPRYMPEPESNPEAEMIQEAAAARDLMRSANPDDHKKGLRAFDQNIAARLGNLLPGAPPNYRR